jgi:hypothetical protein
VGKIDVSHQPEHQCETAGDQEVQGGECQTVEKGQQEKLHFRFASAS